MKLAISGKGGVGKSTVAAALALILSEKGKRVLALDADPDANLAAALGFPAEMIKQMIPISEQINLIEERTGAKVKQYGQMFKLNPDVSDVSEKLAVTYQGVSLLVLGAVRQGGSGCACPENVFIRSLVTDLVLNKDDLLIIDLEAGVEHLGRATAKGVDAMLVVVEPGQRSIDCAERIVSMSKEIGIQNVYLVINKVDGKQDEDFVKTRFPGTTPVATIPFLKEIRMSDQTGESVIERLPLEAKKVFRQLAETCSQNHQKN